MAEMKKYKMVLQSDIVDYVNKRVLDIGTGDGIYVLKILEKAIMVCELVFDIRKGGIKYISKT